MEILVSTCAAAQAVDSDTVRTIKVDDNFKARFVRAVVDSKKTIPDLVYSELRLRLK